MRRALPLLILLAGCQPMPLAPDGFDLQGHRGARGLAPENTLPAFQLALDLGVTTLELDTVIGGDGAVVVSHEPWMAHEICQHPDGRPIAPDEAEGLLIHRMPYEEVARFDCGSRRHPRFPRQASEPARKPLLQEVFALAEAHAAEHGRPISYNVETKSRPAWDGERQAAPGRFVELLWEEVERAGVAARFTLQSFDVRTLQEARRRKLPIRLALLVEAEDTALADPAGAMEQGLGALGFTPDIYSPDYRLVTAEVLERAHGLEMLVIPWTVNDVGEMRRLRALGVDGLITDYPDLGVKLLDEER